MVTAVAIRSEKVVAAAAASTDSDALWQIGIDVQSKHRGRGLGAVLTSRGASAVLARGKVPFYGSRVDNIASRRELASQDPACGTRGYRRADCGSCAWSW